MLIQEDRIEAILKFALGTSALSGNRDSFALARSGILLDEVFYLIIVNVVCGGASVLLHATALCAGTYNTPTLELSVGAKFLRTSSQRAGEGG